MHKKRNIIILMLGLLVFFGSSISVQASSTHTIRDNTGAPVKVPKKINRVADLWHANNPIFLMLGGEDKLVATTKLTHDNALLTQLYPKVKKQAVPFNGEDFQMEELIKQKPDVVISSDVSQISELKKAKIPAVNSMFQDYKGLKKTMNLTAEVIGTKAAKHRAKKYNKKLDADIKSVKKKVSKAKSKPSVLHIVNTSDLTKVDGRNTIVDEWLKIAGGKNAIKTDGNMISVSAEEIIKANPDIIIIGGTTDKKALKLLKKDSRFKSLKAVKNKKVYGNPTGIFMLDRYSAEEDLQIWWAAKKFHPELMKDVNLNSKFKSFYKEFFNHKFSNKQISQIINGEVIK
ncbi:ABC transporter substrate-binding protein [Companilactobacillus sp. HBUAS59699]|uniref:ABC transporter substrate-binding protein n=1 Tax=Companilactobacillus sp. HBUAS59699 TaxID=3109358 RepID=UPI002FEF194D